MIGNRSRQHIVADVRGALAHSGAPQAPTSATVTRDPFAAPAT